MRGDMQSILLFRYPIRIFDWINWYSRFNSSDDMKINTYDSTTQRLFIRIMLFRVVLLISSEDDDEGTKLAAWTITHSSSLGLLIALLFALFTLSLYEYMLIPELFVDHETSGELSDFHMHFESLIRRMDSLTIEWLLYVVTLLKLSTLVVLMTND